jgi:NitT/TauT family transport system substrate-binding protein
MMKRVVTRRSAVVTALSILGAAGLGQRAAIGQSLQTLRVVGQANDGFKGVYYGVRSGLFKKYGLDVQTIMSASGAVAATALSGGTADIAYTNILTVVQAHAHNIPMAFVATGNFLLPGKSPTLTLVLKDSPIKSGRDMNGKTLGSGSLRDINAAATFAWVDKTGGDSSTIRVVEVPASAGAAFLEQHRVDAVTLNEPSASLALANGTVRVLAQPYDAISGGMAAGLAALTPYVDANRDVMVRFAKAMHEASMWTNAHQSDTVQMVADYTGIDPEVIAKGARFTDADYVEPRYIQPLIALFAKYGLIDKVFPAQDIISSVALKPPGR